MERWLTDTLGLDWVTADAEAARLEHAVSEVVEQRLYEALDRPATCPHGNPIPGHSKALARVQRDLTPGREVVVEDADQVGKTLRVKVAGSAVTLSQDTAAKVWAVPSR